MFSVHDPQGVKLFSRLRLNLCHLNQHKFRYNFKECLIPMCGCGIEIESTQHFFLRCHFYHVERLELLNSLYDIDLAINQLNEDSIINLVLFGSNNYQKETNRKIYFLTVLLILKLLKDLMNHF